MNLRESLISSLFAHTIIFFVLLALAGRHVDLPGGTGAISIHIVSEDKTERTRAPAHNSENTPPKAEPAAAQESRETTAAQPVEESEASLPEKTADGLPEAEGPPAEAPSEGGKDSAEGVGDAPVSPLGYHHYFLFHSEAFFQKAETVLRSSLGAGANPKDLGGLTGASAEVTLTYDGGVLREVRVASASPAFRTLVGRMRWNELPSPAQYSLLQRRLAMRIAVDKGGLSIFMALQ
jgi:hypothetical protein